jgi:hypothetical protein
VLNPYPSLVSGTSVTATGLATGLAGTGSWAVTGLTMASRPARNKLAATNIRIRIHPPYTVSAQT